MTDTTHNRFEAMVNLFSADLYRYAFWLCRNQAMAEDLVQETYARAWRAFDSLRDESKAKAWLRTTVRREFARQFERYQPPMVTLELDEIVAAPVDSETDPNVLTLRRAIAELPEKYREPLVLQVAGGYSGDEIAELLNLPPATVRTRLFRARQKLEDSLNPRTRKLKANEKRTNQRCEALHPMNCLEFAHRLRTEPDRQDSDWRHHREECEPCNTLALRAQRSERLLHEALSVVERPKVPEDLASRILSRRIFHQAPKRLRPKTRVYALAASLLVTLGLAALMLANQSPRLEDDVVRHVRSEQFALQLAKASRHRLSA